MFSQSYDSSTFMKDHICDPLREVLILTCINLSSCVSQRRNSILFDITARASTTCHDRRMLFTLTWTCFTPSLKNALRETDAAHKARRGSSASKGKE